MKIQPYVISYAVSGNWTHDVCISEYIYLCNFLCNITITSYYVILVIESMSVLANTITYVISYAVSGNWTHDVCISELSDIYYDYDYDIYYYLGIEPMTYVLVIHLCKFPMHYWGMNPWQRV
jgi:hypothetical protein